MDGNCQCRRRKFAIGGNPSHCSAIEHKNGRDIEGFSTAAQAKMYDSCPGCPYDEYKKFYDYYGDYMYADTWVKAALQGSKNELCPGSGYERGPRPSPDGRVQEGRSRLMGGRRGSSLGFGRKLSLGIDQRRHSEHRLKVMTLMWNLSVLSAGEDTRMRAMNLA